MWAFRSRNCRFKWELFHLHFVNIGNHNHCLCYEKNWCQRTIGWDASCNCYGKPTKKKCEKALGPANIFFFFSYSSQIMWEEFQFQFDYRVVHASFKCKLCSALIFSSILSLFIIVVVEILFTKHFAHLKTV